MAMQRSLVAPLVLALLAGTASAEQQCVQQDQTCGGPGLPDSACCAGMKCDRLFMGTHNKQCVVDPSQCKKRGEICGCAGCLTQSCCDGFQCREVGGQGGQLYCVNTGAAFLAKAAVASPAGNSTAGGAAAGGSSSAP